MKSYSSTPASMASLGPEQACCVYVLRMRAGPIETPWRGVGWGRWSRHHTPPLKHVAPVPNFGMPPRVGSSNPTRGGLSAPHTVHHDGPCRRVRLSGPE